MEILFYISCLLSLLVGMKVDQWETITLLGFISETPAGFIEHPSLYHNFSVFLFLLSIVLLFIFREEVGLLNGIIVLFIVFISSGWIGHKMAYGNYRNCLRDVLETSKSEKEKKELRELINQSDSDLLEQITQKL